MMDEKHENAHLRAMLPRLILIDLALITGVLFAAAALFAMTRMHAESPPGGGDRAAPVVTYACGGLGAAILVMSMMLPAALDTGIRRQLARIDEPQGRRIALSRAYFIRNVSLMALLEGAALANLVAYFIEARIVSLPLAGLMVMAMAFQVPSMNRVNRWIELQERFLDNETAPVS